MIATRTLGQSGPNITEIGLGCWQFGGDFGEMPAATAQSIMKSAVDHGIRFFDTANIYGDGRSEKLIGQFLKTCSEPITVATKSGQGEGEFPYSEKKLRQSIRESQKRLQRDTIDLIQLHCVPIEVLRNGEIFDWLRAAQKDGLIQHFGVSVETIEEGLICLKQDGLQSLQVIFNLFRQKLIRELLPQAQAAGVGIIVRLPLASGLLTGKFTAQTTFAPTDHRNYNRDGQCFNVGETFAGVPFEKGVSLTEQLKEFLPENITMIQLALRWILDHEAVTTIIPGASSPDQAENNASISALPPLPESLHTQLNEFYQEKVVPHIRGAY